MDKLIIPYPDFQMGELIDPEQHDINNRYIVNKANEFVDTINELNSVNGSGKVGIVPPAPFTSANVQTLFNELITRLRNRTATTSGASLIATPTLVRIVGDSVEDQLKALDALLQSAHVATGNITNSAVTTEKIADLNVTNSKLAPNAVTTDKISDLQITTPKLNAQAVTTDKIADLNVTTGKLANGSVTTDKLANTSVTTAKLAPGSVTNPILANDSVTTQKIVDANITTAKIADGSVTTAKVADAAIATPKVIDGSITTPKLAINSVSSDKIQDGSIGETKIPTGTIATNHIKDGNVTASKISDRSITSNKIGTQAIREEHLDPSLLNTLPNNLIGAKITTLENEMDTVQYGANLLEGKIGNLSNLATEYKGNLVEAINDVNYVYNYLGGRDKLTTNDKTTYAAAINEVNTKIENLNLTKGPWLGGQPNAIPDLNEVQDGVFPFAESTLNIPPGDLYGSVETKTGRNNNFRIQIASNDNGSPMYIRRKRITWGEWEQLGDSVATTAEAQAGTNNTKVMTPLRVNEAVASNNTIVKQNLTRQSNVNLDNLITPGEYALDSGVTVNGVVDTRLTYGTIKVEVSGDVVSQFVTGYGSQTVYTYFYRVFATGNSYRPPFRRILTQDDYNELFQSGVEAKTLISNALTAKGVPTNPDEYFSSMATKIGYINTGLKYATGTYTAPAGNRYRSITINGLSFTPHIVNVEGYSTVNSSTAVKIPNTNVDKSYYNVASQGLTNTTEANQLYAGGFRFTYNVESSLNTIYEETVTWHAWGI